MHAVIVQPLSCVWFCDPMDCSTSVFPLSFTISWSLVRLMSTVLVMLSNYLISCHPLYPFAFNLSQHQSLFQRVGSSHQVPKYWSFSISSSSEYSGLISFRIHWFDLLAVQGCYVWQALKEKFWRKKIPGLNHGNTMGIFVAPGGWLWMLPNSLYTDVKSVYWILFFKAVFQKP